MPTHDFTGRVIAVTGAGGRLGGRLGQRLLQRGATVAAIDRPEPLGTLAWLAEGEGSSSNAHAYPFDATGESAVRDGFARIREEQGRLDALVHTVGTWAGAPLLETSQEDFERLLRLNLTSAFLCFREAARQMQKGHAGGEGGHANEGHANEGHANEGNKEDDMPPQKRLIGVASQQGADRGAAQQYGYSASKAGVVRLVEAAAAELRGTGITTCAVAPSTILFGQGGAQEQEGVPAGRLVALIEHVLSPAGDALSGATLRAYGSAG